MKKALKKILVFLFSAVLMCSLFASCGLQTKIKVTFIVGNEQYAVLKYDLNQQIVLPSDPEVEGKAFVGWYTDKDCTIPYAEGKVTDTLTLYAKFSNPVIYIIVNTNGGESVPMIAVEPGGTYEVPEAVKEGHTFTGYYYYDKNGVKQDFPISGTMPVNEDVVIFASYATNVYTVTLDDGFSTSFKTEDVEYGKTYAPKSAVRVGYDFVAWHTVKDNQSEETVYDSSTPVTEDITLYAQYVAKSYKITLANTVNSTTETYDVVYDGNYSLVAKDIVGYTFKGFTFDGEEFVANGTYAYDSNIRILANYEKNVYSVEFKDGATVLATVNVEHGKKVEIPALNRVGYTYELSAGYDAVITQNTVINVTYSPVKANVSVFGVPASYSIGDVYYDGEFTIVAPDRGVGYEFLGFTGSDGKTYLAGQTYTCDFTELVLTANWNADSYEIYFLDGNVEIKDKISDIAPGTRGMDIAGFPVSDLQKTGYTLVAGWYKADGSAFDKTEEIRSDLYLYAKYTANTYLIVIENNGGTGDRSITATYGSDYSISTPVRKGYTFDGYVNDADGDPFALTGKYTVADNVHISAVWVEDRENVTFYVGDENYHEATVLNGFTVSAPTAHPEKVGHTFKGWFVDQSGKNAYDFSAEVTDTLVLYAYFEANVYTVTVYDSNGNKTEEKVAYGTIPSINMNLTDDYRVFNGYYTKFNGQYNEEIDFNVPYYRTEDITVYQWWTDNNDNKETDDLKQNGDYFVEKDGDVWTTYVYIVGHSYNFVNTELIGNGHEQYATITVNGTKTQLVALKAGEFEVTVNKFGEDGSIVDTYVRTIKIVEKVFTFTVGDDYYSAWTNRQVKNWNNNEKGDIMVVGADDFRPDVKVQTLVDGKLIDMSFGDANVEYTVLADGVLTTDYEVDGGSFYFGSSLIGKTITLTMAPRYAIYEGQTVTFEFNVNDGFNVYTDAQLRDYYENGAAGTVINVLRNIKVMLSEDRTLTAKDVIDVTKPPVINGSVTDAFNDFAQFEVPADIKAPLNKPQGSGAYDRVAGDITINGNYYTLDGSGLPLVDGRLGIYKFGSYGTDYIVQNVQFGIFKFGELNNAISDVFKMENLYILGNMNLATNWGAGDGETYTVTIKGEERKVLTQSGAAIGIMTKSGNVHLDNVTMRRCTIGVAINSWYEKAEVNTFTGTRHAASLKAKDVTIEDSWANDLLSYGFGRMELDSCYMGRCSGSAIHVDSLPSLTTNPELHLTNGTVLENWINGNETWFNVYGMNYLAAKMTGMVNSEVMKNTDNKMQAYKADDGLNKVNLAILVKDGYGGGNDVWVQGTKDDVGYPTVTVTGISELSAIMTEAITNYVYANIDRVQNGSISLDNLKLEGAVAVGIPTAVANAQYVKFDATSAGLTGASYIEGYIGVYPAK